MNIGKAWLALVLAAIAAIPLKAQYTGDTLTPLQAFEFAREHHPALLRLRSLIAAKDAEYIGGFGLAMPEISYAQEGIPNNGTGFSEQRISFVQRIDFPLRTLYRLQRINSEQRALAGSLAAELRHLKARIKAAYVEVLYTRDIVQLRQRDRALLRDIREAAELLRATGETSRIDVLSANIRIAEAEHDIAEAQKLYAAARLSFLREAGVSGNNTKRFIFPDSLVYSVFPTDTAHTALYATAQPDVAAAALRTEAAAAALQEGRASWFPALTGGYYRHNYGSGYTHYGFEIGLSLPLWFMSEQRGTVQKAEAEYTASTAEQHQVQLDVQYRFDKAHSGFLAAQQTIQHFEQTTARQADTLLSLAVEAWRAGDIDMITLVDARRAHLAAQLRRTETLRLYYLHAIELEEFFDRDIVFTTP